MNRNNIGRIIAINISVLVIVICVFICFSILKMFFNDILIINNIILLVIGIFIVLIPLMVSVKLLILLLKRKISVLKNIISELFLIPLSLIYLFVCIFVIGIVASMIPVRDYHKYKYLYDSDSMVIRDFPSSIPDDAYDVKFYYESSALQKGSVMNLYYKVDSDTVKMYKDKYKKIEIDKSKIDVDNINKLYLGNNIKIDDNYRLYFLYSYCDESGYCNHGEYSYVAINEKSNECIFVLSKW